ncbi:ImuA family protein [Afifella pfennigii]|uniref:ImuA family protein n=1 Tax=Afifella pfennigii TaxID=209897 RepID=UPI000689661A|nr:hypothetical protein [Afifella pfennigii]
MAEHIPKAERGWRAGVLSRLRQEIGALEGTTPGAKKTLPFDAAAIDKHLPDGGLRLGALHEIWGGPAGLFHEGEAGKQAGVTSAGATFAGGAGDIAAATLFLAAILARLEGPVLWCLSARDLFAPSLASVGLCPDRVIHVETWHGRDVLAAMEEGLKHQGLAAVVGETARLGLTASRRLQLAAETSGVTGFVLCRPFRQGPASAGTEPTAAVTRWQITPLPSSPLAVTPFSGPFPGPFPDTSERLLAGIGPSRWRAALLRCRGADPALFVTEAADAAGRLGVSALLPGGEAAPSYQSPAQSPAQRPAA